MRTGRNPQACQLIGGDAPVGGHNQLVVDVLVGCHAHILTEPAPITAWRSQRVASSARATCGVGILKSFGSEDVRRGAGGGVPSVISVELVQVGCTCGAA
jgi:hypothetical protein